MGNVPAGLRRHPGVDEVRQQERPRGGSVPDALPNGVDFWWDEFTGNNGNCWFDNVGAGGGPVTSDPPAPLLPSNCNASIGSPAYAAKALILLECYAEWESRGDLGEVGDGPCYWYQMPARPGTDAAAEQQRRQAAEMERLAKTPEAQRLEEYFSEAAGQADGSG